VAANDRVQFSFSIAIGIAGGHSSITFISSISADFRVGFIIVLLKVLDVNIVVLTLRMPRRAWCIFGAHTSVLVALVFVDSLRKYQVAGVGYPRMLMYSCSLAGSFPLVRTLTVVGTRTLS
jgi:hypothetical protein